jgi:hypothetical protein
MNKLIHDKDVQRMAEFASSESLKLVLLLHDAHMSSGCLSFYSLRQHKYLVDILWQLHKNNPKLCFDFANSNYTSCTFNFSCQSAQPRRNIVV